MIIGDAYTTFAILAAIWAFEPGPNGLYFCIRSAREGKPAAISIALGTALFNAFIMLLALIGLTGLGDMGAGAYVLKAVIALAVVWLVGLNLFNVYNVRKASKIRVTPAPEKVTAKVFFRKFGTGLGWGAMNPVNIAVFCLIAPLTQDSAVSTDILARYTLTLLGLNLAGLMLYVLGENFMRRVYRIGWVQVPLHIAGRGSFLAYAIWTIITAGKVLMESLKG